MRTSLEGVGQTSQESSRTTLRLQVFQRLAATILLIGSSFLAITTQAQTIGTGAIQGTVKDEQGALIQGAEVTATDPLTGFRASQKTSSSGTYRLSILPPSTYTVTISAPGFKTSEHDNVTVPAMEIVGLSIRLTAGAVTTSVKVTAIPPQLDTADGSLEVTMPSQEYTNLPLAMSGAPKNPLGFVNLMPGAVGGNFGINNLNGGVGQSSFLYINGMPVVTSELQGDARNIRTQTSTEVVDQFQVITSGVPAYYQGSGVTNLIMKSGTNQFHGDIYENIRNTVFDAAGYFAKVTPVEHQNEFGVSLGGPVLKNRLFFYFNYDGYRFNQGANPQLYSLPTAAEQQGDFSALLSQGEIIYDPATTSCNINGICTRQPFPNNVIPANRISTTSKYLESLLPPTINSNVQNNYFGFLVGGVDQNMYSANIDFRPFASNHITFLTQHGSNPPVGLPPNGGPQLPLPYTSSRYGETVVTVEQITDSQTITPNLINDFGFQFNRFSTPFTNPSLSGDYAQKAGLLNLPSGEPQQEFPGVSFAGPNSPTFWANNNYTQSFSENANTFTTQDNITWARGRHNLTFGAQFVREQENDFFPNVNDGFNFSNNETAGFGPSGTIEETTGNAYASYLLGEVDSVSLSDTSVPITGARYSGLSAYIQDDWHATTNLTINAGLRYDIPKPFTEVHDHTSWLDATLPNPEVDGYLGALQFAGNGPDSSNSATVVKTHYGQFSPRLGFAYNIHNKYSVRGSYTFMRYKAGALGGNAASQGTGLLGYSANPTAVTPDNGITAAYQWNNPFPAYTPPPFFSETLNTGYNTSTGPTAGRITYPRPNTAGRMPYTEYYNLTFEHQVTPTIVYSLSYAGNYSQHIPTPGGYNIYSDQLNPKYMALGNLLQTIATPTSLAAAQAIIPGLQLPYANFSGTIGQMLRPFPQYAGVGDPWADFSSGNYNSFQAYAQKTMSKGLLFLVSYTWSKELDNTGANVIEILGAPRSAYNLSQEYSLDVGNTPQVISISYVYQLPFGRGRAFGGSMSRTMDAIVGGWQLSGIDQYSSGTPLGPFGAACDVPYTGGCYADRNPAFSGAVRINGSYGSVNPKGVNGAAATSYINVKAFQNPAPFTFGNTARTAQYSLYNPWNLTEDLSLRKTFQLPKGMNISLQADAFNLFNRVVFGGISTNITSTNFGQVTGQSNQPRNLQFETYITF